MCFLLEESEADCCSSFCLVAGRLTVNQSRWWWIYRLSYYGFRWGRSCEVNSEDGVMAEARLMLEKKSWLRGWICPVRGVGVEALRGVWVGFCICWLSLVLNLSYISLRWSDLSCTDSGSDRLSCAGAGCGARLCVARARFVEDWSCCMLGVLWSSWFDWEMLGVLNFVASGFGSEWCGSCSG